MIYLLQASRKALPSLPLELCSLATGGTQEGEGSCCRTRWHVHELAKLELNNDNGDN